MPATTTKPKTMRKPSAKAAAAAKRNAARAKAQKAKPKPAKPKAEKTSAREAAEVVLLEAGRPMHYREIAQKAVEKNLIRVKGRGRKPDVEKTTKTIRSYLAGSVQDPKNSQFVRLDPGIFDLKKRPAKKGTAKSKSK